MTLTYFHDLPSKPKGSQLADKAIVDLYFGKIDTKCCNRNNNHTCTYLNE